MRHIFALAILALIAVISPAQSNLFFEDFDGVSPGFGLNTTDVGSAPGGANSWVINNLYLGGSGSLICFGFPFSYTVINTPSQPVTILNSPNSKYLHTASQEAINDNIFCSSFAAADGLCTLSDYSFAAMSSDVNTIGYDSVSLGFWWNCGGGSTYYGEVYYSTNGGINWSLINTPISQYNNTGVWTQQTITLPQFSGNTQLRFGFRFVNTSGGFTASDPGFSIDDVSIDGTLGLSTDDVLIPTWCQGEFYNVSYTSSQVFNPGNIVSIELSDATGSFVSPTLIGFAATVASNGSILCLVPAIQTPGTGYRVRAFSSSPSLVGTPNNNDIEILDCTAIAGCTNAMACNFVSLATIDDGSCVFPGCTNSLACNFDPAAGCDNGSCEFLSCAGCMDSLAWNFDPNATTDSGCCFYLDTVAICGNGTVWDNVLQQCVTTCQADFDYNGLVNTADLLSFLLQFGTICN